jgi:hypothetical protein
MDNKKTCFLVMSYTDTRGKEFCLINLIKKLKDLGHTILLSSHTMPSSFVLENIDHFIYDSNNQLVTLYPTKSSNFKPAGWATVSNNEFEVRTKFAHLMYYSMSAASLMFNGLITAKNLGFEKCHLIEYDSTFDNDSEFIKNDSLLDDFDSIYYDLESFQDSIYMQVSSYNLTKYSYKDLSWNENKYDIEKILSQTGDNIAEGFLERAIFLKLHSTKKSLRKTHKDLINNGNIQIDLSNNQKFDLDNILETFLYVDNNYVSMFLLFRHKDLEENQNVKILVNDSKILLRTLTYAGEWNTVPLCLFDELETITIILNNKVIHTYDFLNQIEKDHLKQMSIFIPKNNK